MRCLYLVMLLNDIYVEEPLLLRRLSNLSTVALSSSSITAAAISSVGSISSPRSRSIFLAIVVAVPAVLPSMSMTPFRKSFPTIFSSSPFLTSVYGSPYKWRCSHPSHIRNVSVWKIIPFHMRPVSYLVALVFGFLES